ncbi:hypothetical protein [Mycolicibacterium fluoranthenivorans]|jgi:hypothetical protein|uniref:Uncharacterized protein n=1 Tax=Mycolicibacterium fluoranthenivorans TaxID=258505 RepID=A0A1G4WRG3_9MYCO|nr:hypothetical protein [Mycolicibacterium fluoranthenivorans]SCX28020.1 hypothetical protein SAMN02799620_04496 [Mycolicibacterium fluoranthenivorans]
MATTVTPEDALAAHLGQARWGSRLSAIATHRRDLIATETAQHLSPIETDDFSGLEPQISHKPYCRWGIALAGVGSVLLVSQILDATYAHPSIVSTGSAVPLDGLTIFAVFFVAALAIERLLEPFSDAILPTATSAVKAGAALRNAGALTAVFVRTRSQRRETATSDESDNDADSKLVTQEIKSAATKAENLSVRQLARTTAFWVIATCAGMVVAASMNLYFLSTIGIAATKPWWAEVLATGLIIGGGTKPLHDLVKLISKSAEAQAAGGLDS